MLWDMVMMAIYIVWVLWNERNNRIFNQQASSVHVLITSVFHFVDFWAGHMEGGYNRYYFCKKEVLGIECWAAAGGSSQCVLMEVVFCLDSLMVYSFVVLVGMLLLFCLDFRNSCCFVSVG